LRVIDNAGARRTRVRDPRFGRQKQVANALALTAVKLVIASVGCIRSSGVVGDREISRHISLALGVAEPAIALVANRVSACLG
jgi:hypothetical protein